jgi:hypothetical protein
LRAFESNVLNSTESGITRSSPAAKIAQFIFSPCLSTRTGFALLVSATIIEAEK